MGGEVAPGFDITGERELRVIAEEIQERAAQRDPFAQFTGEGRDNCVILLPDVDKVGSSVTLFVAPDIGGDGVKGNQNLSEDDGDEGNGLPFTFRGSLLARKQDMPNSKLLTRTRLCGLLKTKRNNLSKWFAFAAMKEKYYSISHAATNQVIVKHDGTGGATAADLAAGDTFNTYVLDEMLDRAENGWTDGNGAEHPPLETQYIEETTEHGIKQYGEYYPVFVGPKSYASLIRDPRWITEQEGKAKDGISTYLKGFGGTYRNAVIIKVPKLTESNGVRRAGILRSDSPDYTGFSGSYTDFSAYKAGDNTVTEINFMLGVGALAQAFDESPDYGEDDNYDSGRKLRIYEEQFMGAKKVKLVGESTEEQQSIFHNKDYGVIVAPSTII